MVSLHSNHCVNRFGLARRRGFSFTEVLFAVMVLGIGFIMIAAMFPVTIKQTQLTIQDTVGANLAKAAVQYIQQSHSIDQLPATGPTLDSAKLMVVADVPSVGAKLWADIAGNAISAQNPKFGWTMLYRRGQDASEAQIYVVVTQSGGRPDYRADTDLFRYGASKPPATLEAKAVPVAVYQDANDDLQKINIGTGGFSDGAAEGGYVIIGEDTPNDNVTVGRVFQLGNRTNVAGEFYLQPGSEWTDSERKATKTKKLEKATGYIVGRSQANPANPPSDPVYEGLSQDIGVYTTFIRITPQNP